MATEAEREADEVSRWLVLRTGRRPSDEAISRYLRGATVEDYDAVRRLLDEEDDVVVNPMTGREMSAKLAWDLVDAMVRAAETSIRHSREIELTMSASPDGPRA